MVRLHPHFLKIDTGDKATGTCEGEEKLFMGMGIILRDNKKTARAANKNYKAVHRNSKCDVRKT